MLVFKEEVPLVMVVQRVALEYTVAAEPDKMRFE